MRRFALSAVTAFLALATLATTVDTQSASLRVINVAPEGELNQLSEANEIRIVFSEPMIPLGRTASNAPPPWITIAPAASGTWRWSGTTILIFTPEPTLPLATRYTVTVAGTAASDAGRPLGTPYTFTFTTPTVKLQSVRWQRRQGRFDQPVHLALTFNQAVRPADIQAHTVVRYERHEFDAPVMSARDRARLQTTDPTGVQRFDAKVASARQAAARQEIVGTRVAPDWDRERFPPSDRLVVLETTTVPPPGTWLDVTVDAEVEGIAGRAHPPNAQSSTAELDPVFFARGFRCQQACDPSSYNGLALTMPVPVARFSSALTVRDITTPAAEQAVTRTNTVAPSEFDDETNPTIEDAGYARQPPARTFAYRLDPTLQAEDGQTLGYPFVAIVQNRRESAFTSFGDGHGVWESAGGTTLPFYARNYQNISQWLTRILPEDLMPRITALQSESFRTLPPGAGTGRKLNVTPDAVQSHGIDLRPALTNGVGLVWAGIRPGTHIPNSAHRVDPERADRSTIVQVTNLGITVKDSPQSTLVFVTRLDNGAPVDAATVTLISTSNQQLWRGVTGADGVAMAPALPLRKPDDWYEFSFIATAEKDGDVAYVASDWNEGIMPWDFGHGYQLWESTDILRGSVFTDRGVYRPGEEVHAKAILRNDTPTGVRLMPAGSRVDVKVSDSRGKEVDRRTLTLNRWSSAEWTWTVPSSSTLGSYSVQIEIPGTTKPEPNANEFRGSEGEWLKRVYGNFLVAAYRRPDFRVDATLTADQPVAGATLTGRIDGRYLFGSSLSNRPVKWSITRQLDVSIPESILEKFPSERYAFGYYPNRHEEAERVAGEEARLDANGTLAVTSTSATNVDVAYRYTLEGDVEDISRQHIANRTSVVVHPAPWYIGLRRPAYFADVASGTSVDVVAADLAGNAVAGVPVTVALTRVQWNSVRRAEGGGFYTWDTEEIRTPAGEWTVTSAASPVTLDIPLTEGGSYILSASAQDAAGRRTKTETQFYGLGRGYTAWQRYDHNRFDLEPEKATWKPGETARVMIRSPWESATALLTVEREGIRRYQRFALTSTQQTVEVPITADDIPNVFVSVMLIRGRTSNDLGADGDDPNKPAFKLGYAELKIEDSTKRLGVDVAADRAQYRPANTARVSVTVRDSEKRPVAGELTLWAVDHGVLSLTGYGTPDVSSAVYQRKSLQVMTEDNRQRIVSRRVLTPKGEGEGGGGGAEGGPNDARRDFRPLAFWLGSVETNADGTATREVALPESLTTYRIMAVAADSASRFGSGNAEIAVSKPVTLLPALPRFLTNGDRASIGAVVTNTMTSAGGAVVTIRSLDPALLEIAGDSSLNIQLGAGTSQAVRFGAIARGSGTARVRMTVALGNETDAFELPVPVTAPTPLLTTAAFGDTDSRATERIALPAGIVPGVGGLNVNMASTALVGLGEGARYLINYPFGCAEQTASAALALSLAIDLHTAFNVSGSIAPADFRPRAAALVARLSQFQCDSGGFAYWQGACFSSNIYLTSYVLHVMFVAKSLGLDTDQAVVDRALDYLDGELKKTLPPSQVQRVPMWGASQAFSVKVLAEHGRNQDSNITRLVGIADRLPVFALSYLADAIAASGTKGARYDDVVRRIMNAVRVEGERAHVQELDSPDLLWLWNSNVRSTAIALDGMVRRGDDPVHVARLVRGLLESRRDGRWGNTQENAMALEALVSYYRKFESEIPDMAATVALGGQSIGTAAFRGRTTAAQEVALAMPDLIRQVPAGAERELALTRTGTGRLFYSARLQYALTTPLPVANEGIRVERTYSPYVENGDGPSATSFAAGDLVRVTLAITVPQERRFVAVSDPLPGGAEAVDGWFRTTALDLARDRSISDADGAGWWFDRGGFDHVEKYDDRVQLFATRLAQGRHTFTYLVRATTAGTFRAPGTTAEEMYAPEVNGRSAPVTLEFK